MRHWQKLFFINFRDISDSEGEKNEHNFSNLLIDQAGHWLPQFVTQDENSVPDSSDGQNLIHSCNAPPGQ